MKLDCLSSGCKRHLTPQGGRHVALKTVRSVDKHSEAAGAEIRVLQHLSASDPSDTYQCVQMLDTFDFMKEHGFQPLSMEHIKTGDILTLPLTHTDLNPENILFVRSDYTAEYNNPRLTRDDHQLKIPDIKVAGFGNATYDDEYHTPEVILGHTGCILMEYYTGNTLFLACNNKEHLAMMEQVLRPLPRHLIQNSRKCKYFTRNQLAWNENTGAGQRVLRLCKPLLEHMTCSNDENRSRFDLIGKKLEYDPAERFTLEAALKHPFFFPLKGGKKVMVSCR
uniref:dual-specificity kinase n=1 Tax=Amazona collaria TaxID=241587 RepID=A0A8B9GFD3_9PSIT